MSNYTQPLMNNNNTTIDPGERAKFNHLAETWWDPSGPMWPLHGLNEFRTQHILPIIKQHFNLPDGSRPLKQLSVLDVGCGGGLLSESLSKYGASVKGIDIAANNIEVAKKHAAENGLPIHYQVCEAKLLEQQGSQFDVVMNMEVVEHVADIKLFIQQCNALVKPGGLIFFSTINKTFKAWLFAIFGAEYVLRLLPKGTHQWDKFVCPEELMAICSLDNMNFIWKSGVQFNPFSRTFKLSDKLAVNYMMAATKVID